MTERKPTNQPRTPQPGDLYNHVDEHGNWLAQWALTRYIPGSPPIGEFRAPDGRTYSVDMDRRIVRPCKLTSPRDDRDPVEVAELRRYRQRSRTTAPQRGREDCTAKQIGKLFALARERRLDHDDLRRLTPRGSVKNMSMHEASSLIDRLQGNKRSQG